MIPIMPGCNDSLCDRCELYTKAVGRWFNHPPIGSSTPFLYVVGSFPSMFDVKGEYGSAGIFTDKAAKGVKRSLCQAGLVTKRMTKSDFWEPDNVLDYSKIRFYNVMGCRMVGGVKENEKEIKICSARVLQDIRETKPDRILCLGEIATTTLFPDINRYVLAKNLDQPAMWKIRGTILDYNNNGKKTPCMLTFEHGEAHSKSDKARIKCLQDDIFKIASKKLSYVSIDTDPPVIKCLRAQKVKECFDLLRHEKTTAVAFDFETTGKEEENDRFDMIEKETLKKYKRNIKAALTPYKLMSGWQAQPYSISFSILNSGIVSNYAIPLNGLFGEQQENKILEAIARWIFTKTPYPKIGHNLSFDLKIGLMLYEKFFDKEIINNYDFSDFEDTMLMSWLMNENCAGLKSSVVRWLGVSKDYGLEDDQIANLSNMDLNDVLKYNALDTYFTLQLYMNYFHKFMKVTELYNVYQNITKPATWAFLRTWRKGIPYDVDECFRIEDELSVQIENYLQECKTIVGDIKFNPASADQEARYYRGRDYEVLAKTDKGKDKMDDATRQHYIEKYGDKLAENVSKYKKNLKILGTYLSAIAYASVCEDSRVRPHMNLVGTNTGRQSCSMPNIQNFPKRNEEGKTTRLPFKAPPGYKYCAIDLAQIEARLIAIVSGDTAFLEAVKNGLDIHKARALKIFKDGLGYEEGKAVKFRQDVKGFTFGVFYGAGAASQAALFRKVAKDDRITEEFMKEQIEDLFDSYPQVRIWQKEMEDYEIQNAYIRSVTGRRRRSPMSINQRLNATIQGLGSDVLLSSYIETHRKFWIAMAIHDDLTFLLKDDENFDKTLNLLLRVMVCMPWLYFEKCDPSLSLVRGWLPFGAEVSVGDSWYSLKEIRKADSIEFGGDSLDNCIKIAKEAQRELSLLPNINFCL